jgi:hypothetical protein
MVPEVPHNPQSLSDQLKLMSARHILLPPSLFEARKTKLVFFIQQKSLYDRNQIGR